MGLGQRLKGMIQGRFRTKAGALPVGSLFLAAFGKHPGWNDHMDAIGLETAALVDFKRALYDDGIRGNIDGGTWDRLEGSQALEAFDHTVIWSCGVDTVIARMWPSTDGKGRQRYPMIVSVQVRGLPRAWVVKRVSPVLEELREACCATDSSDTVREEVDQQQQRLRATANGAAAAMPGTGIEAPQPLVQTADNLSPHLEREQLLRALYIIERDMATYASRDSNERAQQLRVPTPPGCDAESALPWLALLSGRLHPDTPKWFVKPCGHPWADLIAGVPGARQFYCLRVTPEALPLTTEIPYTLDKAFVARVSSELGDTETASDA